MFGFGVCLACMYQYFYATYERDIFVLDLNEILHRCKSCVKVFCRGASTYELRSQAVGDVAVMAGPV